MVKVTINKRFIIKGLIFESKEDYYILKNIDKNINETVNLVKNNAIEIYDVFKDLKKFNVTEFYFDSRENLDDLFKNATTLLSYEDDIDDIPYKVGLLFFNKINLIDHIFYDSDDNKYIDNDSDNDNDSDSDNYSDDSDKYDNLVL